MQPKDDGYQPKWRHFHPQSTVWVMNPFEHDVVFYVADEQNIKYKYTMRAGKTSELPGGLVATLGVKNIVDELIQTSPDDIYQMWNKETRAKYEDQIIIRIKEAPSISQMANVGGEVDLSIDDHSDDEEQEKEAVAETEKPVFPTSAKTAKKA